MLPAFPHAPRKIVTLATAAAVMTALAAPPAMAWGDRQQGFLTGVAAALAVAAIANQAWYAHPAPRVQNPAPVHYTPPPTYTVNIFSTPTATAFNSYPVGQRVQIQSRLAAQGYYNGRIDGAFGPTTYNAVVAYAKGAGKPGLLNSTAGAYTVYDGLLY